MENKIRITESFKAIQTSLEALEPLDPSQREFALSMILKGLGMSEPAVVQSNGGGGAGPKSNGDTTTTDAKSMTPKEFLREKKPHTDLERLTCLAFYLTNVRDTPHFKTEEITALNTEAAGAKFSNASATARNAVSQNGFLSHAGSGKKQLTPLGEDVVNALPDREAMAKVIADAPKRRKPGGKPKAKKGAKS